MNSFPALMAMLAGPVFAQQPSLIPVPVAAPAVIASDSKGGIYIHGATGGKPAILHFTSAGELRTLVREEDVAPSELYHSPWDLWISGDSTRVLFPVFQHVAEFHVAEVMQVRDGGKISPLLSINQKLTYEFNGQSLERYMVNARGAWVSTDGIRIASHLASFPVEKSPALSMVLFNFRPEADDAGNRMRVYADLEMEDRSYSSLDPGCDSREASLFGLGSASSTFFQPRSFTLIRAALGGQREILARGALLNPGALACSANEVSAIYRDESGKTQFLTAPDGQRPRAFFESSSVNGVPVGEINHHVLTSAGSHYLSVATAGGTSGVFSINGQGEASTVLEPGFAGPQRVLKSMVESGGRLFFITDNQADTDPAVLAFYPYGRDQPAEPRFASSGVVNAASFERLLAPGAWATIFGQRLAPASVRASTFPLPSTLGGVQVFVNGMAAPLSLVSPSQINFLMPWEPAAPAEVSIEVANGNLRSQEARVDIVPAAPALFRVGSNGPFIVTTPDYKLVDETNPCTAGTACILWANSLGRTNPLIIPGQPSPVGAELLDQPDLSVNEQRVPILYAGLAPGLAGIYQINFLAPDSADGSGATGPALSKGRLRQGEVSISFTFHTQ